MSSASDRLSCPPAHSPPIRPLALFLVATCLAASVASASTDTTRVVMLGTGTPNPDPDRSGPSVAVIAGGRAYLVDCGPGVVRRAAAAAKRYGIAALEAQRSEERRVGEEWRSRMRGGHA